MGLEHAAVYEIVEKAVAHKWGIPEFQRGFVWTPQKVRDLMDSLWRGYPVGAFSVRKIHSMIIPIIHGNPSLLKPFCKITGIASSGCCSTWLCMTAVRGTGCHDRGWAFTGRTSLKPSTRIGTTSSRRLTFGRRAYRQSITRSSFTSGQVHSQKQALPTSPSWRESHFRSNEEDIAWVCDASLLWAQG